MKRRTLLLFSLSVRAATAYPTLRLSRPLTTVSTTPSSTQQQQRSKLWLYWQRLLLPRQTVRMSDSTDTSSSDTKTSFFFSSYDDGIGYDYNDVYLDNDSTFTTHNLSYSNGVALKNGFRKNPKAVSTRVIKAKKSLKNNNSNHTNIKNHSRWHNTAMSDTAFLRKRTSNLLRLTAVNTARPTIMTSPPTTTTATATNSRSRMKADQKTFHFLMDAWAFSGEPDAAEQARRLLERMEECSQHHHQLDTTDATTLPFRPDVRSYTKVINALSRSAATRTAAALSAGHEAERLLEKMIFLSATDPSIRPNTFTYTAVIEAHANAGAPGSAQRAAELCHVMATKYLVEHDTTVRPTARAFHAAITALGKCGAAAQAQELLERLVELYERNGIAEAKPNAFNYNALISAWANCGDVGSASRAETVLERMEAAYRASKDDDVKPTTVSYNAVIDAYAKSGEPHAAEQAEEILRHMEELYTSGENVDARPNVRSFNSVINAWAKSGHEDAATKAQDTLDHMEQLYEQGNEEVRPDLHSFCTVINAIARSPKKGKAVRAWNLFRQMKQLHEAGNTHLQPNVVAYNAVLNACAFTSGDVPEQNRAVEIAHAILKELEVSRYGRPDQVTYGTFLKVCYNQMPDCNTRQQIVEMLFQKCCKDGQVGSLVLSQLKAMASDELFERLVGVKLNGNVNGHVEMHDLPKEWWCNVVEGRWRRKRNMS